MIIGAYLDDLDLDDPLRPAPDRGLIRTAKPPKLQMLPNSIRGADRSNRCRPGEIILI
jgi:hypothetical protein